MPKTNTVQKNTKRVAICVFRGLPSYRDDLTLRIKNIKIRTGKKVSMESMIEHGINLALVEWGEKPIHGRLQGRYSTDVHCSKSAKKSS